MARQQPNLDNAVPAPLAPARWRLHWLRWLAGLAIVAILGVVAMRYVVPLLQPAAQKTRAEPPQSVGAATIGPGDIRVVLNALGTVAPLATVTVKTQINGRITQIGFREGQLVQKGDFLAQIDPRPYQVALEQAQGTQARDQALLRNAQADAGRYQKLLAQDSIARQQVDTQAALVRQYEGTLKTDQAAIDSATLNLEYCHIVAPITGRVGLRQVDQGNYVQASDASGLVVITQLQPISVVFSLPEDVVPQVTRQLHAGTTLQVAAWNRADTNQLAVGELLTTDNQVDTATGTVKLRAGFANADEVLFPNQFVNAKLLVNTLTGVVVAPLAAIQRGEPGTFAYVIGADDTVHVRPVTLGPQDGQLVAVTSGLQQGDRVVVDGADRLREGAKVVVPERAKIDVPERAKFDVPAPAGGLESGRPAAKAGRSGRGPQAP